MENPEEDSLLAEQEWPSIWFKGLYHFRWGGGHHRTPGILILAVAMTVEAVRPDRSFPRKMKPVKIPDFHRKTKRCR